MFWFIPIGHDQNQTRHFPSITLLLIVLNVAIHIFTTSARRQSIETFRDIHLDREKVRCLVYYETGGKQVPRHNNSSFSYCLEHSTEVDEAWNRFLLAESIDAYRPLREHYAKKQKEWLAKRQNTLFFRFAFIPNEHQPAKALTAAFLHGDYLHLLGNMLFLYLAGIILEDTLGIVFYLALYFLSTCGGALLYYLFHQGSPVPLIGASGAIAGLLGAFLLRFARTKIIFWGFLWAIFTFVRGRFRLPAYLVLPLWFLLEIRSSLQTIGETSGTAYLVHIGGFVIGAAFMGVMIASGWTRRTLLEEEEHVFRQSRREATAKRRVTAPLMKRYHQIEGLLKRDQQVEAHALATDLATDLETAGLLDMLADLLRLLPGLDEQLRLNDRTYMELSSNLIAREDLSSAYRYLEELPRIYPNSNLTPKAMFQAARLAAKIGADDQRIVTKLEELAARFPDHPVGQQSVLALEHHRKTGVWRL